MILKPGIFLQGRYEILEKIGSGGMSDVYKAKDHKLNRLVAIKVLKEEFGTDETFVSKFKMEAQAAAGLSHPNIVNGACGGNYAQKLYCNKEKAQCQGDPWYQHSSGTRHCCCTQKRHYPSGY